MDKQEIILTTALRLFVQNGFHATPTSKIAKEAGVANGTLFHYYKTKEDLIVSLYLYIKSKMGAYIDEQVKPDADAKAYFKGQFKAVVEWSMENRDEFYYAQLFTNSPFAALLSPEDVKKSLKKSCDQIQEAIDAGVIKARDVDFIYTIMGSHIFGLYTYLIKNNFSKTKQQQVIQDSLDMLWGMLS
ncbi:TetR/AcrR family transcriptional regulator [Flavobacterium rakeshii]|uniref:TetR/AcrR family transcriptional regulator n=1 Tax=Flavobacterium rakeshii TaxID=1038845 RepID=UPI002E7B4C30|nr:TetR/AcrR family transcriptional regulator [Flavobacterium rakeshii]MEE1897422.1 TetR/AcrR family transcriptional regulator [Flavobacterium rakeshii]